MGKLFGNITTVLLKIYINVLIFCLLTTINFYISTIFFSNFNTEFILIFFYRALQIINALFSYSSEVQKICTFSHALFIFCKFYYTLGFLNIVRGHSFEYLYSIIEKSIIISIKLYQFCFFFNFDKFPNSEFYF